MLKAYIYCLSTMLIIDMGNNTMFTVGACGINHADTEIQAREKSKRITKATINKHISKYGEFVICVPILSEYAPEYVREWDKGKGFIGAFESWDDMRNFINQLDKTSRPFFEKYNSCNDWADILEYYSKARRGLSEWDKNHYRKHISNENSTWHKDAEREVYLMNLLAKSDVLR